MKKIVLNLFTLLLVATCLTGCSKSAATYSAKNPATITLWHYYNGSSKEAFDALVENFNLTVGKESGIIVDAYAHGGVNELADAVLAAANKDIGSSPMPDIFAAYSDNALRVDQLGLVANLDDSLTEAQLSAYYPAFLEEGRFRAGAPLKILAVAKSIENTFVNITDFDKFAADTGSSLDEFATWESLAKLAARYYDWTDAKTQAPDDGKALFGIDAMANFFISGTMQLGVEIYDLEGEGTKLNFPEEIARKFWECFYMPFINGHYASIGRFRSDDAKVGDVLAYTGSSSGSVYFPKQIETSKDASYPIKCVALPYPHFESGVPVVISQGAGMAVTKSTPEREKAAAVFLDWFTRPEHNVNFAVYTGYMPVRTESLNFDMVNEVFKLSDALPESTYKAAKVTYDMLNTYTLYSNKPFDKSFEMRKLLEGSMKECAKQARAQVVDAVAQGQSASEVVAELSDDAHFSAWYDQLIKQADEILSAA